MIRKALGSIAVGVFTAVVSASPVSAQVGFEVIVNPETFPVLTREVGQPMRYQYVGISDETNGGDAGIGTLSRSCESKFGKWRTNLQEYRDH